MAHRNTPFRLVATAATGLVLAAGLLAGCGSDSEEPTATAATTAAATAETAAQPVTQTTPVAAEPDPGVVSAEGAAGRVRFRFVLTELRRSGPTAIVNARLEYVGGDEDRLQISDTFDDGQYQELEGATNEGGDVFDGIALIDPDARKKYLVARDENGRCVCSNALSAEFLDSDAPVMLQATLAAPPEDVTEIDLVVPNVKTFSDVPISE